MRREELQRDARRGLKLGSLLRRSQSEGVHALRPVEELLQGCPCLGVCLEPLAEKQLLELERVKGLLLLLRVGAPRTRRWCCVADLSLRGLHAARDSHHCGHPPQESAAL